MKAELQQKLYENYPEIFKQKDLDMTQTAMCWGIDCGDGWYTLIDELCGNIKNHVDNFNRNKPEEAHMICGEHGRSERKTIGGKLRDGRRRTGVAKEYPSPFCETMASEIFSSLYDVQGGEGQRQTGTFLAEGVPDPLSEALLAMPNWAKVTCPGCHAGA